MGTGVGGGPLGTGVGGPLGFMVHQPPSPRDHHQPPSPWDHPVVKIYTNK